MSKTLEYSHIFYFYLLTIWIHNYENFCIVQQFGSVLSSRIAMKFLFGGKQRKCDEFSIVTSPYRFDE